MRELPILMCPEMVKAADEGRKTHHCQIERLKILNDHPDAWKFVGWKLDGKFSGCAEFWNAAGLASRFIKPRYQAGDILWVKEPWGVFDVDADEDVAIGYKAGPDDEVIWLPNKAHLLKGNYRIEQWRSSRYMFKDFARLWLRVTAVKDPHQVQNISEEDAIAEGIDAAGCCRCSMDEYIEGVRFCGKCNKPFLDVDVEFGSLWDRLHPKPGERFEDHPWVFPYVIEKIER